MASSLCPRCGKPYPKGQSCPRCATRKYPPGSLWRRSRELEAQRLAQNPWRTEYGKKAYLDARQRALADAGGCCRACGRRIADMRDGRWTMRRGAGGVHHVKALSEGGVSEDSNLVPLCAKCHNRIDSERRRGR